MRVKVGVRMGMISFFYVTLYFVSHKAVLSSEELSVLSVLGRHSELH
jgi:hypothetical protein